MRRGFGAHGRAWVALGTPRATATHAGNGYGGQRPVFPHNMSSFERSVRGCETRLGSYARAARTRTWLLAFRASSCAAASCAVIASRAALSATSPLWTAQGPRAALRNLPSRLHHCTSLHTVRVGPVFEASFHQQSTAVYHPSLAPPAAWRPAGAPHRDPPALRPAAPTAAETPRAAAGASTSRLPAPQPPFASLATTPHLGLTARAASARASWGHRPRLTRSRPRSRQPHVWLTHVPQLPAAPASAHLIRLRLQRCDVLIGAIELLRERPHRAPPHLLSAPGAPAHPSLAARASRPSPPPVDARPRPHDPAHTSHDSRHTIHVTRFTPHDSRHTIHVTRFTPHDSRHTIHATRFTPHDSRHTIHATPRHATPRHATPRHATPRRRQAHPLPHLLTPHPLGPRLRLTSTFAAV